MKSGRSCAVVLVTAPDPRTARRLARAAVGARLAACATLIPRVESHYWWQGKIEQGREVLLIFKTSRAKLPRLEKSILKEHPYDTPEFVVLPVSAWTNRYLDWISASVG
jgi:periplasmic divalent cation tolerance protein